ISGKSEPKRIRSWCARSVASVMPPGSAPTKGTALGASASGAAPPGRGPGEGPRPRRERHRRVHVEVLEALGEREERLALEAAHVRHADPEPRGALHQAPEPRDAREPIAAGR